MQDGKVAIYEASDDLPFTDPLNHLGRVKFHSDLDYIKIVNVIDYTLNLPAIPTAGSGQGSGGRQGLRTNLYTLGPHGRAGIPFVIGEFTLGGVKVASCGSVPVGFESTLFAGAADYYNRWIALGSDATNITVYEYSVQQGFNGGTWHPRIARSVPVRVYITDVVL
jgi:hypothetical protein